MDFSFTNIELETPTNVLTETVRVSPDIVDQGTIFTEYVSIYIIYIYVYILIISNSGP